jgi:HAD superfamily hydrolase (TIGR01509 family)
VPGSELFEGVFVSADHLLVKPQQSIYRRFCEHFGLQAGECVFIDDFPLNIEGAVTAGWQGLVFHDAETLRQALRRMGAAV